MTSSLLVQKMMSIKLSTGEFEKIKWLRSNNNEKTFKTVSSLRKLLQNPKYRKTCRLCLKPANKRVFDRNDFDVPVVIKQMLQIQVTQNDDKPQYICNACEEVLRNADQLRQTAEVTQWRLQQELELMTNMESDSEEKEKKPHGGYFVKKGATVVREWSCGKCRQTFDSQKMFTEHGKLPCSRGEKSFVCETCGLELKSMTRLKRHMLIHTGELLYPCVQCPYRGRTKYALMVHERAHSGERPLTCPHCPATFLNSSNLASHKRRHLPPAYHCHVCVKSFRFKEALQNHLATQHSTAKPHVCNACGKAFSTRKMIRRHERRVHNRPKLRSGVLPTYLRQQQQEQTT